MRTPCPECGSHQCCTSPSTNCRAAARSRCSRVNLRSGSDERHAVLQLVAKAVGAARLIERRAGPDAAGERLIEQPAVQHDVHRPIGRLHLDRAEHILPVPTDLGQTRRRDRPRDSARSGSARPPRSQPRPERTRLRRCRAAAARWWCAARRRDRARPQRFWRAPSRRRALRGSQACRCGR